MQNGGKRKSPIEAYPKFWNLNPLPKNTREVLRIPARKYSFDFVKRKLENILEWDVLLVTIPEFTTVRRMTLGMNSPMMVPLIHAREAVEQQQKAFNQGWEPLFSGYTAAVYFHMCDGKIISWTTQAEKMRCSMPHKYEVQEVIKVLVKVGFEKKEPMYDSRRMIVEDGHKALKDEIKFKTRRHLAPYGLEEMELQHEGRKLKAAGALYVS